MTGIWSDLAARFGSRAILALLRIFSVWIGGHLFHVVVALVCGLMVWELVNMLAPRNRPLSLSLAGLAGGATLVAIYLPPGFALPLLLVPAILGFGATWQWAGHLYDLQRSGPAGRIWHDVGAG